MAVKEYHPEQLLLLWAPPQDVLPDDHLCFVVDEIVERLDLSGFPDRRKTPGHPAYDARVLVKVLFYGYAYGYLQQPQVDERLSGAVAFHFSHTSSVSGLPHDQRFS